MFVAGDVYLSNRNIMRYLASCEADHATDRIIMQVQLWRRPPSHVI